MEFGFATFVLAYLAGALSTLSPCVVPLLPILVASAVAQNRFGLWALAAGLALSFTAVGLFIATIGVSIGIDSTVLHRLAGAMLIGFGAVMALPRLQAAFVAATARLARGGNVLLARTSGTGSGGQFVVGLLLGVVWTPCVGPTLGAASTLASEGRQLGAVAALMLVFGIGAASASAAYVANGGATSVDTTSVTLNGTYSVDYPDAVWSFEYGPTTSYGTVVPGGYASPGLNAVSVHVTGLT
ncbi:MAG: hypothetical protein M3Y55_11930, partial [Pseudomonadota bacterium]|nr:hypothetical protein [Pseudomonadota bacterium]